MATLTTSLESATQKKIDHWLKKLVWVINEESPNRNFFIERKICIKCCR